jgi:DNA repair protein RecO (recombination protein O)
MAAERTEAIILRVTDFSETSRIVSCFSRDFGRISALAKGGRRLKGPFESALDLLSVCELVLIRKSSSESHLDLLTAARLVQRFHPSAKELLSLYGGYYVAELLTGLTEEHDPHPRLYDSARETLVQLERSGSPDLPLLRFEMQVLGEIGQAPTFDLCVGCGADLAEASKYAYSVSMGGLLCSECRQAGESQSELQAGSAMILRKLADPEDAAWTRLSLSRQQTKELQRVTAATIGQILGRKPKMWQYIHGRGV